MSSPTGCQRSVSAIGWRGTRLTVAPAAKMFGSSPVGCSLRRFVISRQWDCGPSGAPRASARGASPWVAAPLHASARSRRRASHDAALARARVTTRASTSSADSRAVSGATANQPADGVRRRAIRRPTPTPGSVSDAVPSTSTRSDEPDDARCPERSPRKPSPAPRAPNEAAKPKTETSARRERRERRVVRVETRRAASTRATSQRHALQVQVRARLEGSV